MKTILAPVDFSPISATVTREAVALARALKGRVVLFSVVQPPPLLNEYSAMLDVSEITAAAEKNAARKLRELEETVVETVPIETIQVIGMPVPDILDQAKKSCADYIVMGSHGHTAFYDLMVGSTTHGVLSRASCPVLIVPTAKREAHRANKAAQCAVL